MVAIQTWDEVFVRASRADANALIAAPAAWAAWWPGCQVQPTGAASFDVTWRAWFPLPARHQLTVTVDRVRPRDKGLEFTLGGDLDGRGEWFHIDQRDGVVVHHLLRGDARSRTPLLWRAAHRGIVRSGLNSLKDRLEAGRRPGAEPHPALLAGQARELDVYALELAKHEAEQALAAGEHTGTGDR